MSYATYFEHYIQGVPFHIYFIWLKQLVRQGYATPCMYINIAFNFYTDLFDLTRLARGAVLFSLRE